MGKQSRAFSLCVFAEKSRTTKRKRKNSRRYHRSGRRVRHKNESILNAGNGGGKKKRNTVFLCSSANKQLNKGQTERKSIARIGAIPCPVLHKCVFAECKSLQILGPFFRHSVCMVISVLRSSHIDPKFSKSPQYPQYRLKYM